MEKKAILKELNAIGAEVGYPFYVFADGSYSSKFVNGKMNAIMTVKKPFQADSMTDKAKDALPPVSATAAKPVQVTSPPVMTPQQKILLNKAVMRFKTHQYPKKEELLALVEFGTNEDMRLLFDHWLIEDRKAFAILTSRTDLSGLQSFVKKNLHELEWPLDLCMTLLLCGNDNLAKWYIEELTNKCLDQYTVDAGENALVRRCASRHDFQLLELYLERKDNYCPGHELDDEAAALLVETAASDAFVQQWLDTHYTPKA